MEIGSLAEWVGAVGIVGVLAVGAFRGIAIGTLDLEESTQAGRVAAWATIRDSPTPSDGPRLVVTIANTSSLPVFSVETRATGFRGGLRPPAHIFASGESIDVLLGGQTRDVLEADLLEVPVMDHWAADWTFTDVAGLVWRRDGRGHLLKITEHNRDEPYRWD
jgi:hypothetical protein